MHQPNFPPPALGWRELKNQLFSHEFWEAMSLEFRTLESKKTFQQVTQTDLMHLVLLKWVFTYRFGGAGYVLKFKARICVRGDL